MLEAITADAVRRAVAEFDDLTRTVFLKRYGFGRSKEYFLIVDGKRYDSKAVVGAAYQHVSENGDAMRAGQFKGGEKTVSRVLERLGFKVERRSGYDHSLTFERGRTYNRRADIHAVFRGQERGGIATPTAAPFIFLFTGQQGTVFGYQDGMRLDGVFEYTGEGQVGDMAFIKGNRAIRDHAENGKDLLLFETLKAKGQCRFLGSFVCDGWELRPSKDKDGASREVIVFHLVPAENLEAMLNDEPTASAQTVSLDDLRRQAYAAARNTASARENGRRTVYARSRDVRDYVFARAKGACEACKTPAPFTRTNGTPYLEPHHTRRLSDGGPDHPKWVGAVCPTCHRRIHHGADGKQLNEKLQNWLDQMEGTPPSA